MKRETVVRFDHSSILATCCLFWILTYLSFHMKAQVLSAMFFYMAGVTFIWSIWGIAVWSYRNLRGICGKDIAPGIWVIRGWWPRIAVINAEAITDVEEARRDLANLTCGISLIMDRIEVGAVNTARKAWHEMGTLSKLETKFRLAFPEVDFFPQEPLSRTKIQDVIEAAKARREKEGRRDRPLYR